MEGWKTKGRVRWGSATRPPGKWAWAAALRWTWSPRSGACEKGRPWHPHRELGHKNRKAPSPLSLPDVPLGAVRLVTGHISQHRAGRRRRHVCPYWCGTGRRGGYRRRTPSLRNGGKCGRDRTAHPPAEALTRLRWGRPPAPASAAARGRCRGRHGALERAPQNTS